ncbi:MAG: single-stranded-DNA-specific exonuclease RecJ [Ruminococcus sp.]|nr:single-stranded-DNA-specific exonuclease RecJ [Ruminococcus sp.]
MKRWRVNKPDHNLVAEFMRKCDLNKLTLEVMVSRGYTDFDSIAGFFSVDTLDDPFIIKDMQSAVDTINDAVDAYDLICVYGDYDCDGVTATAVLYNYLLNIGANVMYYIPERSEGYGMNMNAVEKLHDMGVQLIVTVDNGISAIQEADRIAELGMKLVVTDHHQPSERLPKANAVIDLHRQDCPSTFKNLAGVGVALKLCAALDDGNYDMVMEQYADICALGTIADIVPLKGENRTIVRNGLMYMKNTENPALGYLMEKAKVNRERLNSVAIAFQMAPKINAAGRFGSPLTAVKAILSEDDEDAENYVDTLMTLNDQRKSTEAEIMTEIFKYIDSNPHILDQRVLVISGKGWHHGVIGIVSSKILDYYGKPNVIISIDDNGVGRGSARSVNGFNIFKCFSYAQDYIEQFGGHECAGGLTLKEGNIAGFTQKVLEYANSFEQMPTTEILADKVIMPEDLSIDNIKGLSVLEPFGAGNPEPVFAMAGVKVDKITALSQGKHTRLDVTYANLRTQVLIFSHSPESLPFAVGDLIDLMVNVGINVYNGKESVSIKAIDYRLRGINQDKYFAAKDCYEKYCRGEVLPTAFLNKINSSRSELVNIYKYISSVGEVSVDKLYMKMIAPSMNYCKLRLCIDAFSELGLVSFVPSMQKIRILPVTEKVDLENSSVLKSLRAKITERGN